MAERAQPKPATLPLPGGRPGATVRLHPLVSGRGAVPPAYLHRDEGRLAGLKAFGLGARRDDWVPIPFVSFLVEHPGAGPLLVDTGLHPSIGLDPALNLGRLYGWIMRDALASPEESVTAQLLDRGLDPREIATVVMTHLHFDHTSAMTELPEAAFLVDELEWEAATAPFALLHGYVKRHFSPELDVRLLDFDAAEVDSFTTFGRSLDIFGDGSVRLVATPGHTDGHVSVVVRLRDREALLCGDAAYTMRTLERSDMPGRTADDHLFRRSLREMQRHLEQTPGTLVVPGHDLECWEALESVYE